MKIRNVIFSWDFSFTVIVTILCYCFFPNSLNCELTKDIYSVGISVLSIVFSVFFAALAIIISSGDNDFINFIESNGNHFTKIIASFKFSLVLLFIGLLYSILVYTFTSNQIVNDNVLQSKWILTIFAFIFFYGLFASLNSTLDAIKYAEFRTRFSLIKKNSSD
ncbi:MAG: hypothetical protein CVV25_14800 [Ignavibacteriae bacterium HGW-Ignavibacteriae-4]|jgi:uncharacterized protein YacL|nr:MAG: hypothetical protein CVV25_14800 [Ignavibacteriae bacterium HGW-Ignavibacteriae-4]